MDSIEGETKDGGWQFQANFIIGQDSFVPEIDPGCPENYDGKRERLFRAPGGS
jgi:hypothetical protein